MSALRGFRIGVWLLVAVAASLWVGLSLSQRNINRAAEISISGKARIGGPFKLTSHRGELIDNARLAGKPYIVFFGFTYCPDICPTTLFELTDLMTKLGPRADRLTPLFITVDPERDTQEALANYMSAFDGRILALRGDKAETDAAVKAFGAYYKKVPTEGGQYTMDHTAGVILIDANGEFAGKLDMHEPRDAALAKLERLVGA